MRVLLPLLVLSTLVDSTVLYSSIALLGLGICVLGLRLVSPSSWITWFRGDAKYTIAAAHDRASSIVNTDRVTAGGRGGQVGLTVLVVDDDLMVASTCCSMLRAIGIDCLSAKDGREAIDISSVQGGVVDLVILDLMMPGLPSHKVVKELWTRDPGLPVVIATGWDRSRIHPEILRSPNVRRVLYKPYDLKALRAACELSRGRGVRKSA